MDVLQEFYAASRKGLALPPNWQTAAVAEIERLRSAPVAPAENPPVELAISGRPDIRNPALTEVLDAVCERHSIALSAGMTSRTAMLRALQEAWRRLAAPVAPARPVGEGDDDIWRVHEANAAPVAPAEPVIAVGCWKCGAKNFDRAPVAPIGDKVLR